MQYIGALIGDYCGSKYEWSNFQGTLEDTMDLIDTGRFTDDSVLTVAVMDWLNHGGLNGEPVGKYLKEWARKYPKAGYGGKFRVWVASDSYDPIGSFGNGSAMRVSACAYYANTLEECLELAKASAEATHDHPEGIKGAQAIAEAIYLARSGAGKDDIKRVIEEDFGYDLNKNLEEIGRRAHRFDATCQVTVPEAIICFLNSQSFLDAIRVGIWIGGDSDTIAAIAGSIAEAYYGVPSFVEEKFKERLPEDFKNVIIEFNEKMLRR
jgi:ADP-ribosylglycohydrolase